MHGKLVVRTDKGERTYLLGGKPHASLGSAEARSTAERCAVSIDWRTAPLGEVFLRYGAGEPYELDSGASGVVVSRSLVDGDAEVTFAHVPAPVPSAPRPSEIVLDPVQRAAVELPAGTSLVLDGEAGVGKTLVALHRIAHIRPRRALVLVPTEGLRRLTRVLADRLGIAPEIAIADDWLVERARKAFPGLPKQTSEGASAQVIALKRNPAVRGELDAFVGWKQPRDAKTDDKVARSRARLLHLFGDKERLARIAAAGGLPERAITATMAHTRIQFEQTTERANRHVDADRLVAIDGRALDAGTPTENVHTFDVEDVPVLFELARRKALPLPKLPRYDHVFVDEAQLRAPMELAAIADACTGSVTLAGDQRQASDDTAYFTGWDAARAEFPERTWEAVTLAITYRSVPAIAEFARAPRLPAEPPADPAVWASRCDGAFAQATALCWHLDMLRARDSWRSIAIVARNPEHARRLHAELRGLDATLVVDGDFLFEPGVTITHASAISGLEFDCVVIPDLTPAFWPPQLARAFYVAATRARDWLWLLTPETWSPLCG